MGNDTMGDLLDIFGRVEIPNLDDVPDENAFNDESLAQYRIPNTPIRITRIDTGPREGEFLFNSRTVLIAPRFFLSVSDLPLRSNLGIRSWSASLPQLTGPYIPAAVVSAMPPSMRALWLDTPIWKIIATTVIGFIAALVLAGLHRWLSRTEPASRIGAHSWRLIHPVSILIVVALVIPFVDTQINTSGRFSSLVDTTMTILIYSTSAWLFWIATRLFVEWIILSPRIAEESLDANAHLADMEIVNWAQCDELLINETIGVRYETTPDQLRYVLAQMREMLHAHPRINNDTIRVRFSGYGDSALNITIRVYAKTREFNDFHAIREDLFLRIYDLVTEAGTGFAFPSRTLYMGKDDGLDEEAGREAEERVSAWRRAGQLPFPRFKHERLQQIDDTLDYPPKGSHEAGHEDLEAAAGAEHLSAETLPGEDTSEETDEEEDGKAPAPN